MHIVLEGIDGSGKTTLMQKLREYLETQSKESAQPVEIQVHREPSRQTQPGQEIRRLLSQSPHMTEELRKKLLNLFLQDRLESTNKVINPFRRAYPTGYLLQDRSWLSTAAYQANSEEESDEILDSYLSRHDLYKPDVVLYLRLPIEEAISRMRSRNEHEVYETRSELKRIHQLYEYIFSKELPFRVIFLDARQPTERILKEAIEQIKSK